MPPPLMLIEMLMPFVAASRAAEAPEATATAAAAVELPLGLLAVIVAAMVWACWLITSKPRPSAVW